MGTLELPNHFHSSYEIFKSYPNNLVYQTSYSGALQEYVTRLDNAEGILFIENGGKIFVPFRDLGPAGQCTFPMLFLFVFLLTFQSAPKAEHHERYSVK
jgi:hypothetical protein